MTTTTGDEEARLEAARAEGRKKLRAGIYARMSIASIGDTTKVDDQERICRDLAERLGWDVADVYTDNSASAWSKRRKRPAWERMLADVEAGQVGAIVVYHGDRLVRQPHDLERLLALTEAKGVRLASPTGTRDLDDASDRFVLRILTAQACMESDNTSRRRKSQYERWRREGKVRPGGRGGRAYGFATDGVTHVEAECEVIRDMARRVLRGESARSVARAVSAAGARTPTGGEFTYATVRKMLVRPRLAGLMPDGESKGAWDPVLDRETWERVVLVLDAKADAFGYATNARRWLLSGIAVCGRMLPDGSECGTPMRLNPSRGRGDTRVNGYQCTRKGCATYRSAETLDAYVTGRVIGALNRPETPEGHDPAPPDMAPEWHALATEKAAALELLSDHTRSAGFLTALAARLDGIDARMAELRDLEASDARSRLLARYAGITREEFEGEPLEVRRALVRAAVTVTVLPASKRGPGFRPQDLRVVER